VGGEAGFLPSPPISTRTEQRDQTRSCFGRSPLLFLLSSPGFFQFPGYLDRPRKKQDPPLSPLLFSLFPSSNTEKGRGRRSKSLRIEYAPTCPSPFGPKWKEGLEKQDKTSWHPPRPLRSQRMKGEGNLFIRKERLNVLTFFSCASEENEKRMKISLSQSPCMDRTTNIPHPSPNPWAVLALPALSCLPESRTKLSLRDFFFLSFSTPKKRPH